MPILDRCVRSSTPQPTGACTCTNHTSARHSIEWMQDSKGYRGAGHAVSVQRSEKYWGGGGKELKFEESRWKFASVQIHRPFQHLVFGAGALSCVAPELLRGAVRLFSWALLREFLIEVDEGPSRRMGGPRRTPPHRISILLPRDGLTATIRLRK